MPSDEKRSDVALALRNNLKYMLRKEGWYGEDLDSKACGNAAYRNIAASVEDCGNLIDGNYIHIVETLADLIDRPTCEDTGDNWTFRCSSCGCELDVEDREGEPTMWLGGSPMTPRHCPNCGAVVTDTLDASKVDGK